MNYPVRIEGMDLQKIEIVPPGMFTGPKLLVNGQPAEKGSKRGQLILHRDDGCEVVAVWKPSVFAGLDTPQVIVDGKTYAATEPLKWYVYLWSALSLGLLFMGGALGGVIGVMATFVNVKIFRSSMHTLLKFIFTGFVSLAAAVIWLILAILLTAAVQG